MSYADFSFYTEEYPGTEIPEDEFSYYADMATARINVFLSKPTAENEVTDELRYAMCEVCDILYSEKKSGSIKYERNDGYWVSFDEDSDIEERIKRCIRTWLFSSGLLYRGRP